MKKALPLLLSTLLTIPLWGQTINDVHVVNATTKIAVVCAGGTFDVAFEVNNFKCPGTVFTIELVKPGGSGPVVVASTTITDPPVNNVVSLTMPTDAAEMSLYQAKVYSTRPGNCSRDPLRATGNTVDIRVRSSTAQVGYLLPPYNGAPKAGPLNICVGQQFQLFASPNDAGINYTWTGLESGFDPLTNIDPNADRIQTTARTAGNYTATATPSFPTSRGCMVTPGTIAINVSGAAAKPTITASRPTVCEGGSTTLSLTNSCPGTVTWNNGSGDIGTGNSITVSPTATTNYTAKCTTTGNCGGSQTSDPLTVNVTSIVIDMIAVGVTPSSPTSGPRTGDIKLNLSNGDVLTYPAPRMWTALIMPNCPGSESVQMQLNGPGLSFSTVENYEPYALFFNQGTSTFYTINDPDRGIGPAYNNGWPTGNYTLTVTPRDQDGSQSGTLPKDRTPQGNALGTKTVNFTINDPGGSSRVGSFVTENVRVHAYPNPTIDRLSVDIKAGVRQSVSVLLTDLQGRSVYQNTVTTSEDTHHEDINIYKQPSGIYLLKVVTPERVEMLKVIKPSN
ncbi:T9SS type A sorting domain-containing protein [Spirosoma taeanense]|uniref:T9SS type A sorting domain-containing protein n=1 Tax=Spirosoma taeanense TaxID=2735870 RepID=A0A6M5YAI0_9BACT|nr:T9SS type A sorting domain-containing protein [Spirosoma taeanense]QJW90975.1 T9SS type A sorting domain-containing protein [Spirosoma taeanense]